GSSPTPNPEFSDFSKDAGNMHLIAIPTQGRDRPAGRASAESPPFALHEVRMSSHSRSRLLFVAGAVLLGGLGYACAGGRSASLAGSADNAQRVYVAPGEYDELYAFLSGGFGGQVGVYGLPSGRLLKTIPVFSQHAENGWGYSEETKPMLETSYGFIPWDDLHHTALSQSDGLDDGRWL